MGASRTLPEANDPHLPFINGDPTYEFLRKDPRCQTVRGRIGLD